MALALCTLLTFPAAAQEQAAPTLAELLSRAMAEAETGTVSRSYHWAEVAPTVAAPQAESREYSVAAVLRRLLEQQDEARELSGLGEQPFLAADISDLVTRTKDAVIAALNLGDWLPGSWLSDDMPTREGASLLIAALVGDAEPAPRPEAATALPPAMPGEAPVARGNLADLAAASAAIEQKAPQAAHRIKRVTLANLTVPVPARSLTSVLQPRAAVARKPKRQMRQPFSAASLGMRLVPGTAAASLAQFLEGLGPLPESAGYGRTTSTRLSFAQVLDQAQWARGVFATQRATDHSSLPERRDLVRNLRLVLTREGEVLD